MYSAITKEDQRYIGANLLPPNNFEVIAKKLSIIFEMLNLPEPHKDEYHYGIGNAGIVFVHQAGCTVRVNPESQSQLIRHPHVMRPIGSIRLDQKTRLDFQFAGSCPVTQEDTQTAYETLNKDEVFVTDARPENFCYTALKSVEFPRGVPVIFDPQRLNTMNSNIRDLGKQLEGASSIIDLRPTPDEQPDIQDLSYADLRQKFLDMFILDECIDTIQVDPEAVNNFWRSMKQATKDERLDPCWLAGKGSTAIKGIVGKSTNYDAHLRDHNPVFAEP